MSYKASYRRLQSGLWEGVVKNDNGRVIWACGHAHKCRDYNHSRYYQAAGAAMRCATEQVRLMCLVVRQDQERLERALTE